MGLSIWTPERLELLRALWADGVPAGEIASRLGDGITRGMVAREAMSANARRTAQAGGHAWKAPTANAAAVERARKASLCAAARAEEAIQPLRGSNPKPWELRGRRECSFPVAGCGSMVLSCCEPIDGRGPYCRAHHALAIGEAVPA